MKINLSTYYACTLSKTLCCRKPVTALHPEPLLDEKEKIRPIFVMCTKCGKIYSAKDGQINKNHKE